MSESGLLDFKFGLKLERGKKERRDIGNAVYQMHRER
jgi:hypothetical protein